MGDKTVAEYECLRGWWGGHFSEYGGWVAVHDDPAGLPEDLADRLIVVEWFPPSRYGPNLHFRKVVEVLERTADRVIVRDTKTGLVEPATE